MTGSDCAEPFALTSAIADIVASVRFADLPDASLTAARLSILDFMGVAIAGAREPVSDIVCATYAPGGSATIIGRDGSAPPHDAAMINGTIGHALDYDDAMMWGHPTPPILPAVLAVAEANGRSCEDALFAYVVGFEVASLIGRQVMATHYPKGFHSTGTIGTFGAAAAVARLLGSDSATVALTLGLAGTQAAGLKCMNGTMGKPFHAGKAAANGVIAASLAARGMTAAIDVLEADQGFFRAQADVAPVALGTYRFGECIVENRFKFHASCYMTHSAIQAVTILKDRHGLAAEDVASVDVELSDIALGICNIRSPRNGLQCKFSLNHCVAFALAGADTAAIETFSDANANAPALVALRDRIAVRGRATPGTDADVILTLKTGVRFAINHDVDATVPSPSKQQARLLSKFLALTTPILGDRARQLAKMILRFEMLGDVKTFMAATRA